MLKMELLGRKKRRRLKNGERGYVDSLCERRRCKGQGKMEEDDSLGDSVKNLCKTEEEEGTRLLITKRDYAQLNMKLVKVGTY